MEKINIALISNVRKLRCAYRILFEHDPQSPARIVLEGPSIETVGSPLCFAERIDLLLLDYRTVYRNERLFFALVQDYFPNIPIILLVERQQLAKLQHDQRHIEAFLPIDAQSAAIYTLITNTAAVHPLTNIH